MSIDFSMGFGRTSGANRRDESEPIRILVLADLSGRGTRPPTSLDGRRARRIDLDEFDSVFRTLAPELRLALPGDLALSFQPEEIDDLHPDALYDSLSPFAELRSLRARLADPSSFGAAAAELRRAAGGSADAVSEPTPSGESGGDPGPPAGSDFERLLGAEPAPSTAPRTATGAGSLQTWIEKLVGPHVVPEADPTQDLYLAALDDTVSGLMRAILHHPAFQRFEAAWVGVRQLVLEAAGLESVQIHLLDAAPGEWQADLSAGAPESQLARLLTADRGPGDPGWSWIVVDPPIGVEPGELEATGRLADLAAASGTAVAATGSPGLLGVRSLADASSPRDWPGAGPEVAEAWSELRRRPSAPYLSVALPRILGRLPYGAATEPIERFRFEEMPASRPHEAYLWCNPAFSLALAGATLADQANGPDRGPIADRAQALGTVSLQGLPVHAFPDDGGPGMQACAEVFLTEQAADSLAERGFTPLVSIRNADRAQVWKLRSVRQS